MKALGGRLLLAVFACSLLLGRTQAQNSSSSAPASSTQPSSPCASPAHHGLDFWVGEWDVSDAEGKPSGRSSIQSILGGCVVFENWTSIGSAYAGKSFNTYDPASQQWTQNWVDNSGLQVEMVGAFVGKNLVYRREFKRKDGSPALSRMTFFNEGPKDVHQLVEQSADGGKTWNTQYDLHYKRRAEK